MTEKSSINYKLNSFNQRVAFSITITCTPHICSLRWIENWIKRMFLLLYAGSAFLSFHILRGVLCCYTFSFLQCKRRAAGLRNVVPRPFWILEQMLSCDWRPTFVPRLAVMKLNCEKIKWATEIALSSLFRVDLERKHAAGRTHRFRLA